MFIVSNYFFSIAYKTVSRHKKLAVGLTTSIKQVISKILSDKWNHKNNKIAFVLILKKFITYTNM